MAASDPLAPANHRGAPDHGLFKSLLARCAGLEPLPTAVVHPCDPGSLSGAVEAAEAGLIEPILVGPKAKILAAAAAEGLNIPGYRLVDTPHSHASPQRTRATPRAAEAWLWGVSTSR